MTSSAAERRFPLHFLIWNNNYEDLKRILNEGNHDVESHDCHGRTPLHLAVTLGHLESIRVLLERGANASVENNKYWTVVQEAVSTGDPDIVQLCLQHRDYQRHLDRTQGIPKLLKKLFDAPDFYVEMKWEFTSWVPLVSRMCPSDTYKVWKSGSNVRIDTTLLGFDNMAWQRGSRSYVFKGNGDTTTLLEIDHDACQVYTEVLNAASNLPSVSFLCPSDNAVAARLTSPLVTTYVDADKISFERSKSGVWGWRSDKFDTVDGHVCKVFSASNVQLVTKTRVEHLSDHDKRKNKRVTRTPLESFLGVAEQDLKAKGAVQNGSHLTTVCHNPCSITADEYFDATFDLEGKDVGRPLEQATKVQKLKARLWLSEDYPLSLPSQVVPIIDLMASSNTHFRKLKDFIVLQLPPGFPVKIEIPLFHVLNARITFGNTYASDVPVDGVTFSQDRVNPSCKIDATIFATPSSYSVIGDTHVERLRDDDDELLQFALQQSLLESGGDGAQSAPPELISKKSRSSYSRIASEEERLMQWALEESLKETSCSLPSSSSSPSSLSCDRTDPDDDEGRPPPPPLVSMPPWRGLSEKDQLTLALELSQREQEEHKNERMREEEELARIMELSLLEK